MAAGLAIMGFGGGTLIGAPLAEKLMTFYAASTSVGVWETLLTLAFLYFVFMMVGAFNLKLPPNNWQPPLSKKLISSQQQSINTKYVPVSVACKTTQFWLLWVVLCLNVTAGIGIIGMASPMLQEIFAGRLLGISSSFNNLTLIQKGEISTIAAGFTGFLSLFNIAGRFVWASFSDYLGRKRTYAIFLALGSLLYATVPFTAHSGHIAWFVAIFSLILSMYGGGFATVPAYLADLFGTRMVGAIHGRLLTAWAAAGVLGPIVVNSIREYQLSNGFSGAAVYDTTLRILSGLLALGFICNLCIRPVAAQYFCSVPITGTLTFSEQSSPFPLEFSKDIHEEHSYSRLRLFLAWLMVGLPLLWGLFQSVDKVRPLFQQ
jgi:MFS family permease